MIQPVTHSERALVYAPTGRDSQVACAVLQEAGFQAEAQADLVELCREIAAGAGLAVMADEALLHADLRPLVDTLTQQEPWSDFPIILLTRRGGGPEKNPAAARLAELLGNVTFLERPFHPTTLISLIRTAVRGRRRQYDARSTLSELRQNEQTLRTALTAGRLGSWVLDVEARALFASVTCKSHYGRTKDQHFGYDDLLLAIHPDDRPRMQSQVAASLKTGDDYGIEYRIVWPDGSIHWVDMRGRTLKSAEGVVVQMAGVSSDITARKNADAERERLMQELAEREAELSRLAGTLEQRVQERTRQLQESEMALRQIQKMETMGQLTGGVAHDFNNLLMAVMGNLDLLRKLHGQDARSQRLIDGALQGAQRGAALTQRMLAFARQQDLQTHALDLKTLILGIRDLLERSLGPQFALTLDLAEGLPPVEVDGNQIELAILNLVINARDAMPDGGPIRVIADLPQTIPVSLAVGKYARVAVVDCGTGMNPETLGKAIEPFFSTKGVGKGTGLGLSMVHGLAVQQGGLFELTSAEGEGTTATLWLPVAIQPIAAPMAETAKASPTAGRSTILVVDDDMLIAMATVDMLEDLGHTVLEANSGPSALKILQSDARIDAMMTDHAMPGMTGTELAERARQLRPGLPILLATGYADLPSGQKSELPRLAKPYMQDALKTEIDRLLQVAQTC